MQIIEINPRQLEQHPDVFYSRLSENEAFRVREIVQDVSSFMAERGYVPYLVAGVGSILRLPKPEIAKDIDIAVAGINYTHQHAGLSKHTGAHVLHFTETVRDYFNRFMNQMRLEFPQVLVGREGSSACSAGSGPFDGLDEVFSASCEDDIENLSRSLAAEGRSDLECFGPYGSKGLQVNYKGLRPIDIQFSFNNTPEQWVVGQELFEDRFAPQAVERGTLFEDRKSEHFFYAVLAEG